MDPKDIGRRSQLAAFLKTKRAQLAPSDVGFAPGPRRRTPGLRREEIAELTGVGHVWYTWLEQGRAVTPSAQVLERLATALRLNPDERIYLFRLARPQADAVKHESGDLIRGQIVDVIRLLEYNPAYVRNLRWDFVAWNEAHARVFGDYSSVPDERRNMLWMIFMEPKIKSMVLNWESVAQAVIARFRADLSKIPEDDRAADLKDRLLKASPDFSRWWEQYHTTEKLSHAIRLDHPDAGCITLQRVTLSTESDPALNVIVYLPADETSKRRLKRLHGHSKSGRRSR